MENPVRRDCGAFVFSSTTHNCPGGGGYAEKVAGGKAGQWLEKRFQIVLRKEAGAVRGPRPGQQPGT